MIYIISERFNIFLVFSFWREIFVRCYGKISFFSGRFCFCVGSNDHSLCVGCINFFRFFVFKFSGFKFFFRLSVFVFVFVSVIFRDRQRKHLCLVNVLFSVENSTHFFSFLSFWFYHFDSNGCKTNYKNFHLIHRLIWKYNHSVQTSS